MMEFQEQWNYYVTLVEGMMKAQMEHADAPSVLSDSMIYSLFAGGKRVRPVICLATCEMLGAAPTEALRAGCALEMIHTYSLIHDDLPAMDDDDMRRGKPSNHKVYGEANAILAGDGLLSLAMQITTQIENKKAQQAISKGALDMVYGQSMDLNGKPDAETLIKIHEKKTGALLKASVLSGAYIAGATQEQLDILNSFSEHFGLLFQITDDILDVIGTSEKMGKTIGKDKRDDKVTFVSLYGLETAKQQAVHVSEQSLNDLKSLNVDTSFLSQMVETILDRNF